MKNIKVESKMQLENVEKGQGSSSAPPYYQKKQKNNNNNNNNR